MNLSNVNVVSTASRFRNIASPATDFVVLSLANIVDNPPPQKEDVMKYIELKAGELNFKETHKIKELLEYIESIMKCNECNEHSSIPPPIPVPNPNNNTNKTHIVTEEQRCVAIRKQGVQCTRKKSKGGMYCGTHCSKEQCSRPIANANAKTNEVQMVETTENTHKLEVIAQEIQGIIYYIDGNLNVYNTEDIFKNINNPKIIAKAVQLGNNVYSIPSLGL